VSFSAWSKRTFVPLKRVDPRFGPIRFMRMSGAHGPSYWEGSGTFAGGEIEDLVDADEPGPTAAQRARRDELEKRWTSIEPALARFLLTNGTSAQFGTSSREFARWSLGSIAFPGPDARGEHLEITYVECDGGELLVFEMDGFEPRALRIGG
jgi:hypothetical protein